LVDWCLTAHSTQSGKATTGYMRRT